MKLKDIVSFRKDLLFNGAVQIGWFEQNRIQAAKAAEHFIFHGPDYHGVDPNEFETGGHQLVDTANFTLDIIQRLTGQEDDDPFTLAIAGYGTGKSHLAVTLASIFSSPSSKTAKTIVKNIAKADNSIGQGITEHIQQLSQPYLVVTINGMQDFDLSNEIIRQVLSELYRCGVDTEPLEGLRPRFRTAIHFTESFFIPLIVDYHKKFNPDYNSEDIIKLLKEQDEDAFCKVSEIYEQKMGAPIYAVGQESLHDFIRVTTETYCGLGKPYAGIIIIFDEFGRYLEFAVQKPHVAGSGALQQLFECVQMNSERVFLLCFIQYELKAYISRIAPELREDLNRYVTRYDAVRKVRLSTNLETLIANLLEKKDVEQLNKHAGVLLKESRVIQESMLRWFPDIKNHSLWTDKSKFKKIICEGCWPFHPISTWFLYKLSSGGKALQQRSALSLLAEIFSFFENTDLDKKSNIIPTDLCNDSLINEFLASERYGQTGATAHAYERAISKYVHELNNNERLILKAVLITNKIGTKVESKEDCSSLLATIAGMNMEQAIAATRSLEGDYGVLEWNGRLNQYDIAGDAIPRRNFIAFIESKVDEIDSQTRAEIFSKNYSKWTQNDIFPTDFGVSNQIPTREWHYKITYTNVNLLKWQIDYAIRSWADARAVDEAKGQLIYCYVGPESNLDAIKTMTEDSIESVVKEQNLILEYGAPIAIVLLCDQDGSFGKKVAQYWILNEELSEEESLKYSNFILDEKNNIEREMINSFSELEKSRNIVSAIPQTLKPTRLKNMLNVLFEMVYVQRIPFPFDGFHTAKGNAARDCRDFTRELFKGNFDRDWIASAEPNKRNRAYKVFDESWNVIDDNGSIRLKPKNKDVRNIIELIDNQIESEANGDKSTPVNIGAIVRTLCRPPYGCNIASAGLLIALYFGRRKEELHLLFNGQHTSVDQWLGDAIQGSFLSVAVLDATDIIKQSTKNVSEWEKLLEEWETETYLLGMLDYHKKSRALEERIPVPQALYYKYQLLVDHTQKARNKITVCEQDIDKAIERVSRGIEKEDVGAISWGASQLADICSMMETDNDQWRKEQLTEPQKYLINARLEIEKNFKKWLGRQTVRSIEHLGKWKNIMLVKIGSSLTKLGYTEELKLLEQRVEEVEQNIYFIEKIRRTVADIENMLRNNHVSDTTLMMDLHNSLDMVQEFAKRIQEAERRPYLIEGDLQETKHKLADFQKQCKEQINRNKDRTGKIYCIERIESHGEIINWRHEVATLIMIFQGHEKDVQDLQYVQKQLDLIDNHYNRLDNLDLTNEEFEQTVQQCINETDTVFIDDAPPLDTEMIYGCMKSVIQKKRIDAAAIWMERNVPALNKVETYDAQKALQLISNLGRIPKVLSVEQTKKVQQIIRGCEKRLDELEVEGLKARFEAMSEENKKSFLKVMYDYIKRYMKNTSQDVTA